MTDSPPPPQVSVDPRPCFNCGTSCTLRCSQCRVLCFCSHDCQKSSWKSHKLFCKDLSTPFFATLSSSQQDQENSSMHTTGSITLPPPTCVILDGMGPIGPNCDFSLQAIKAQLLASSVNVIVIDVSRGKQVPLQVAALLDDTNKHKKPDALFLLGWGAGDHPVEKQFAESAEFKAAAQQWCRQGGRFMVQGERIRLRGPWPSWFDKEWTDGDYYRTDFTCCAVASEEDATSNNNNNNNNNTHWCQWYKDAQGAVTSPYNVKACMVQNVAVNEALFVTTEDSTSDSPVPFMGGEDIAANQVAVAWGRYGEGTVSFFGDVNFEKTTLKIMSVIARGR